MKRTLFTTMCLAFLFAFVMIVKTNKNADTAQVAGYASVAQATNQTAVTAQANPAQQNTLASVHLVANQTKDATNAEIGAANQNQKIAKVAQHDIVALAKVVMDNGGAAQPAATDFQFMPTAYAQAIATSGEVAYDVILPNSVADQTVATQLQFSGKGEANATHLAAGPATPTARFARMDHPMATATQVAVVT